MIYDDQIESIISYSRTESHIHTCVVCYYYLYVYKYHWTFILDNAQNYRKNTQFTVNCILLWAIFAILNVNFNMSERIEDRSHFFHTMEFSNNQLNWLLRFRIEKSYGKNHRCWNFVISRTFWLFIFLFQKISIFQFFRKVLHRHHPRHQFYHSFEKCAMSGHLSIPNLIK